MHQTSPKIHTGLETRGSGLIGGVGEGSGRGDIGGSAGGGGHTMNLLDKLNTMSRVRRRKQEAEALVFEARQAMEDPLMPITPEIGPVGYQLAEGDECSMLEPHSKVSAVQCSKLSSNETGTTVFRSISCNIHFSSLINGDNVA